MHSHHAVVDLAPVAIPLPRDTHGIVPALGNRRLVHHADRVGVGMVFGHDLLATVVKFLLIPLDGFEEPL